MTQWTEEQYQELSRKVARKFDTDSFWIQATFIDQGQEIWLHNDWHTIMELCDKHGVYATRYSETAIADCSSSSVRKIARNSDHNNDSSLAQRVARMLALMEVTL